MLHSQVGALPLDVRLDFLTQALAAARAEMRAINQREWHDTTVAASTSRLKERLATRGLPCWSAVELHDADLPTGVTKTAVLWEGLYLKVYYNELSGLATNVDFVNGVCDTNPEIFEDKDLQLHLNHCVMAGCVEMSREGYDPDESDVYSFVSTNCVNEDVADLDYLATQLGISRVEAASVRSMYVSGDFSMYKYAAVSDQDVCE